MIQPRSESCPTLYNVTEHFESSLVVDEMPAHWTFVFESESPGPLLSIIEPVLNVTFKSLCLISLGHPNLLEIWRICRGREEIWLSTKDRLSARISTITVIVS